MICITLVHVESSFPYRKSDHVVRRLWWRTSSREKRSRSLYKLLQSIVLDPAAAAQILGWGAGGKTRGLWDCGIVAKSRSLKFLDFFPPRDALKEQFGKEPSTVRCLAVKSAFCDNTRSNSTKEVIIFQNLY